MAARGGRLEITVIECKKLEKRWFSRKTFVELEYNGLRYRTVTCKGRVENPKFGDKFELDFVDNLEEINVSVWKSNPVGRYVIGSGRIALARLLRKGYDDRVCPLLTRSFSPAGEIRVIMYYPNGLNSSLKRAAAVFFSLVKIAGCFSF